jgi:diguanylate cyclase (GGDEF)-like protein
MPDDLDQTIRVTVDVSPEAGPSEASLVVIYGPDLGRRYPLDRAALELGRDDTNPIQIPSEKASRRHARVVEHDGQGWIEDLGSTNGTLVNDQQITRAPLAHGDIINIGSVLLKYICGGDAEALYHEELYQLTITDNLTGLRNQRYLFEFLDAEVARALRHGRPLALVLFDIDEFKSINDGRGHLAGDYILRKLPRALAAMVRRECLLARFGGDEFALVMPETDIEGARLFAERLRQRVEDMVFAFGEAPLRVTVSMGVALLSHDGSQDVNAFFKRADDALYRAKESGRNSVVSAAD